MEIGTTGREVSCWKVCSTFARTTTKHNESENNTPYRRTSTILSCTSIRAIGKQKGKARNKEKEIKGNAS